MKKFFTFLMLFLAGIIHQTFADFPIRQSNNAEVESVIAYNSTDHEYLVVWAELTKAGNFYFIGPVMGQRVSENGNPIGNAFTIFSVGTHPDVAYDSQKNEYVVVSSYNGVHAQVVSNTGNPIGNSFELVSGLPSWPHIIYNSLSGRYLSASAYIVESPPSSGNYILRILSSTFIISNQQFQVYTTGEMEAASIGGNEFDQDRYAIAFAPVQSPETPHGRFLLALQTNAGIDLTMLDSDGSPMNIVYNPQSQQYFKYIPFSEGSVTGGEFNVDVEYGIKAGYNLQGPAFLVVWGDNNNTWQSQEWTGIYGGFVNPYKLDYLTTDPVQDNSFPISAIYSHYAYSTDEYAKSWKPKVAYNNAGQKFMVTWRETPSNNQQNDTKVNHIRADREYDGVFYNPNDVISAITGNENPMNPSIAASTISPTALISWEDYRNFSTTDWDVYGNLYTIPSVPSITVTKPNGGERWYIDTEYEITWTTTDYTDPVRIEYSTDGGASFIEIVSSTTNDGSYLWTVPFTLSDFCAIRILDAADSDPFDISDAVFAIKTTKKIVANTDDSGTWSLRQAILDANAHPGKDTIIFKIPGTGVHTIQPLTQLPEITDPVLIDGFSQPGSSPNTNSISQGCNAYLNIELNGIYAGTSLNGLYIKAGSSTIRGLVINKFSGNGIKIDTYGNNVISGNFIGINSSGLNAQGNHLGIYIENVPENIIGGISPEDRNIISGNSNGIYVKQAGATRNKILGNYFGIDITGLNELGQAENIVIENAPGNYIGGSVEGARNIISGSGGSQVSYDPPWAGITIKGVNATNNIVQGNYIGTDVTGLTAIPNHQAGITISSNGNIIGGSSITESNIISGNGLGLFISGQMNIVQGNFIGIQADGVGSLGNGEGLYIIGKNNIIGRMTAAEENLIAFNSKDGLRIISDAFLTGYDAIENRIFINSIFSNGALGINLEAWNEDSLGVNLNDIGDSDLGPNNLQNYPILTSVEVDIGTFVTGSLNSTPNTTFRIDFYSSPVGDPSGYGEGQTHIGWTEVTTDASGNADFYVSIGAIPPAGHVITSTATDPDGNTSEFSNWIKTSAPTTYLVNNTNDSGQGSLRQSIIDANNNPGLDSIAFNIPGTGPFTIQPNTELPAITDPVIIDGYSQPGSHPNIYSISEGSNAILMIELDGSAISTDYTHGLYIISSSIVRGLAINGFKMGITLETSVYANENCIIEGNYIGTNTSGSLKVGNEHGIHINGVNNNIIGGNNPASRNIISGNSTGIWIIHSQNNYILGNYIGTDATGKLSLANFWGIDVFYSEYCFIGGTIDGSENVISGNSTFGVSLDQVSYSYVQKNTIGLDVTGKSELGNTVGIQLSHGCHSNYILDNIICENGAIGIGINIGSYNNFIGNNFIGTNGGWQYDLGNHGHGISIANTSNHNLIENNTIGFNDQCGIYIDTSLNNSINRNSISKNVGKGIETINGGNKELIPPLILTASTLLVTGTSSSGYIIEIFSDDEDEGRYFIGSTAADSSGNFTFALTEPLPIQLVTATCTDLEGNTSEFSAPSIVTDIENEKNKIPTEYTLYQNYPNPFNPSTKISWQSLVSGRQTLKVFDVLGNVVVTLVDEEKEAGSYEVEFSAEKLSCGVYFYQIKAGLFFQTRKMILMK